MADFEYGYMIIEPPDEKGLLKVSMKDDFSSFTGFVPFRSLEKWIADVRDKLIQKALGETL